MSHVQCAVSSQYRSSCICVGNGHVCGWDFCTFHLCLLIVLNKTRERNKRERRGRLLCFLSVKIMQRNQHAHTLVYFFYTIRRFPLIVCLCLLVSFLNLIRMQRGKNENKTARNKRVVFFRGWVSASVRPDMRKCKETEIEVKSR